MQASVTDAIRNDAQAFLSAWFETRRIVQALNFNRFQQEGLSATQFILLDKLAEAQAGASPTRVARQLNVDVTTTMRTVASLIARGLVRREVDPHDRRRSHLWLTEAGHETHARAHRMFVDQVTAAFEAMPQALRAGLVDGLAAFVAASAPAIGDRARTPRPD